MIDTFVLFSSYFFSYSGGRDHTKTRYDYLNILLSSSEYHPANTKDEVSEKNPIFMNIPVY